MRLLLNLPAAIKKMLITVPSDLDSVGLMFKEKDGE